MSAAVAAPQSPDEQPRTPGDANVKEVNHPSLSLQPVPRPRNLAHRASNYSQSRSRQTSAVFPLFHSSQSYCLVRDFAYPPYSPMHYGPVDESSSAYPASAGDLDSSRRVSDPPPWDSSNGPWRDSSFDNTAQHLPNTSFGPGDDSDDDLRSSRRFSKHRKSKSYANLDDHARGRRRNSKEGKGSYAGNYVGHFAAQGNDRNDSGVSSDGQVRESQNNRGPGYDISIMGDMKHPPFREDTDTVPYSPSALEDHRPESASLDESFAGPSLALYDFAPENDNELELREGQIIQVGYRHGQGWLVAMNLETGEQGLVPEEYVRLLRDIEGGWGEGDPDDDDGLPADDEPDDSFATEDDTHDTKDQDAPVERGEHIENVPEQR